MLDASDLILSPVEWTWHRLLPATGCLVLLALSLLGTGCHLGPHLPPVDLTRPGWTVREGQALWTPAAGQPKVAGDLLLATHPDGSALVQFSKTPFPLVTAQRQPGSWFIEFATAGRKRSGHGSPPASMVWLQLPACYQPDGPAAPVQFYILDQARWRLIHPPSGQVLEGFLHPVRRPGWHLWRERESIPFLLFLYGLTREELAASNPGVDLSQLAPGASLRLPVLPPIP